MDRKEKILHMCNTNGKGLEIGPSFSPICPKKDGYDIEIIDHLDKEGLIKHYTGHGVNLDNIEEVDYIWHGESYPQLIGKRDHYDYIIASHVIEHSTDIIAFLNDCSELLKGSGVLSLAIPDKRYCFDYFRPFTGLQKAIDWHLDNRKIHSPGTVCEHFLNASKFGEGIAWGKESSVSKEQLSFCHDIQDAKGQYQLSLNSDKYIDAHNWVLTKNSFELLIYDLNILGFINLQISESFDVCGCEFFVSLKKGSPLVFDKNERLRLFLSADD